MLVLNSICVSAIIYSIQINWEGISHPVNNRVGCHVNNMATMSLRLLQVSFKNIKVKNIQQSKDNALNDCKIITNDLWAARTSLLKKATGPIHCPFLTDSEICLKSVRRLDFESILLKWLQPSDFTHSGKSNS